MLRSFRRPVTAVARSLASIAFAAVAVTRPLAYLAGGERSRTSPEGGRSRRPGHDEEGAVSLLAAVAMAVLLGIAALVFDVGRLAFTGRELQSTSDLAALDGVRALGDLRDPMLPPLEQATDLALDSLARNAGYVERDTGVPDLTVEVGRWDRDARTFTVGETNANAVRVVSAIDIDYLLMPGGGSALEEAIAWTEEQGGLSVGSTLASASVDTTQITYLNRLLSRLLGGTVTVDLVGWQGIAAADVDVYKLAGELGFGTVEELLAADVAFGQLLEASATMLSRSGEAADLDAARGLREIGTSVTATGSLRLGDLLSLSHGGPDAAVNAHMDVFELLMGSAELINGNNVADVDLPVTIPDVASARAQVALIEPPQQAIGPVYQHADGTWETRASTAQGRIQFDFDLPNAISVPTLLGSVTADLNVPVVVELGRAEAELREAACSRNAASAVLDVLGRTQGVRAWIGRADLTATGTGSVPVGDATLVDAASVVRVTASGNAGLGGTEKLLQFTGPFDPSNTQRISGGVPGLPPTSTIASQLASGLTYTVETLTELDPTVGPDFVTNQVRNRVDQVLSRVDTEILPRLASSLSLSIADADIAAWHLDCSYRRLAR